MGTTQSNNLAQSPDKIPISDKDTGKVNFIWNQWFTNVQIKLNTITSAIVALSKNATAGFLSSDGVGGIYSRTLIQGTGITITNPTGVGGNPVISASASGGGPIDIVNNTTATHIVNVTDLPSLSSNAGWIASNYASDNYIQIDTHANQAIPVGGHLYVSEEGAGTTKIQALAGVILVGQTITGISKGVGEAVQIATDTWHVFGNLGYLNPASIRGLVGYWKLSEASGTVALDSSGLGHNGTYTGTVTLGNASILPSATGTSAAFSSTGYVALPTGVLNSTGYPITIFGWGKTPNLTGGQQIVASSSGGFNFYLYSSAHMIAAIAGVTNNVTDTRTMVINTVYMWALTIDSSGNALVYVNGTASSTFSAAFTSSNKFVDTVTLGSYLGNLSGNYFKGTLQNVGICNVALTGAEITNIYTTS